MDSSPKPVDHQSIVFQRKATLQVDGHSLPVEFRLTEGGKVDAEAVRNLESLFTDKVYNRVEGKTTTGEKVVAENLYVSSDRLFTHISVNAVEFINDPGWVVRGNETTAHADVLGFQYQKKPEHFNEDDSITLIEKNKTRAGGGNYVDWDISLAPFNDYPERVHLMRDYHNLVRTGNLEMNLRGIYGGPQRISEFISDRLSEFTWLSSYIQGTLPVVPRFQIWSDGSNIPEYVKIRSVSANVGSGGKRSDLLYLTHHEIPAFLNQSYEIFVEKEEKLNLRKVLGFYIDSLNPRRAVDPRLVSLCIAIEILANQYAPDQGSTGDQIQVLLNGLDVEYRDLLSVHGSFPTQYLPKLYQQHRQALLESGHSRSTIDSLILENALPAPQEKVLEYFWYRSRNHVVHGGSDVSQREVFRDFDALIVLLRRILRKILLEGNIHNLRGLNEFEPNNFVEFS